MINSLPVGGGMLVVFAEGKVCDQAVTGFPECSVAAYNSPQINVISGPLDDIENLIDQFNQSGIRSKRLSVSHAFHSPLMKPILKEFETSIRHII